MTMEEAPAPAPRLSFGTTFGAGFTTVFGQLWMFIKASLLPLGLSLVIGVVAFALITAESLLSFPVQILGFLPFAILAIAYTRLALIGRQAGAVPRPLFGRRTWVYFGYSLLFTLLWWIPAVVAAVMFFMSLPPALWTNPELFDPAQIGFLAAPFLWIIPFYLVYLYFITRFSLVFPAVAVDQRLGLGGSWRLTRGGSGFKLYAALVLLTVVLLVAIVLLLFLINAIVGLAWFYPDFAAGGPGEIDLLQMLLAQLPTMLFGFVFEYLSLAIMIVALASAFAQLSGWGGPRAEILERFE